jgi:hypothetical protein
LKIIEKNIIAGITEYKNLNILNLLKIIYYYY